MENSDWATRQAQGRVGEYLVVLSQTSLGRILERTGTGSDFLSEPNPATPTDPITGKEPRGAYLIEVKTGHSRLTPRQKRTRDDDPDHYEVRRPPVS
jgi:hypothetical protein